MAFETNVFINCPFDDAYRPMLRPILFCVLELGLEPRIALERLDSGETRIDKLLEFIRESKYSIHDLSRLKAGQKGEYFRLNMPFELGLDLGCRTFAEGVTAQKKILVLETERYRYQAALSDIAGSDIVTHGDRPLEALTQARNWLTHEAGIEAAGPAGLWGRFNEFMADNAAALAARKYSKTDIKRLPIGELLRRMRDWIAAHPSPV